LIEDDEDEILNSLRKRDRGISYANKEEQEAFARASWLYGQWLDQEARTNQMPVLSAQPQETVIERLLEITFYDSDQTPHADQLSRTGGIS
jgi:hypothetical protein